MTGSHLIVAIADRGVHATRFTPIRTARLLLTVIVGVLCVLQLAWQDAPTVEERWKERLAGLDPSRPMDYFLLGEEIADSAQSTRDFELARELFGYSGALDTSRLGRSAMLAIASISDGADRARALTAAEIVGGRGVTQQAERVETATIEALAKSFSHFRRGNGSAAAAALKQADADTTLTRFERAVPGGAQAYRDDCKRFGKNGPQTDWPMARALMDAELALRQGGARSVSLDLLLAGDQPLLEIDTSDPVALWGVDPARPWWRGTGWSRNE